MALETWVGLAIVVVLVGGGGFAARSGLRTNRHGKAIRNAVQFDGRSTTDRLSSVNGTVVGPAEDHTLESEFGGTDCVAYASEVTKQQSATPGANVRRSPRIEVGRDRDEAAVPFLVDADGHRVQVDGAEAHIDWSSFDFEHLSAGEMMRNKGGFRAVLRFIRRFAGRRDRRRLYYEACLRPGDTVHVIGTAAAGSEGTDATLGKGGGRPLVISMNEPTSVGHGFRQRAKSSFMWAGILVGAGGLLVLLWAGIL